MYKCYYVRWIQQLSRNIRSHTSVFTFLKRKKKILLGVEWKIGEVKSFKYKIKNQFNRMSFLIFLKNIYFQCIYWQKYLIWIELILHHKRSSLNLATMYMGNFILNIRTKIWLVEHDMFFYNSAASNVCSKGYSFFVKELYS